MLAVSAVLVGLGIIFVSQQNSDVAWNISFEDTFWF